ncbi:MAG: HsdR family type I site-specific deoxyribonuclease [bacterium]
MQNPLSENSTVHRPLLKYASEIGWQVVTQDEALSLREGETGLFFYAVLRDMLLKLNPKVITSENEDEVVKRLQNIRNTIEGNKEALDWLRGKKSVYVSVEKRERNVRLIDFDNLENNIFQVTEEWSYTNGKFTNRADIIFLINGIPIVIGENKKPEEKEAIPKAVDQLRRYHTETPELVTTNQLFDATHLIDFFYGVTWNLSRKNLFNWKEVEKGNFEKKVKRFFDRERILRVLHDYIVFFKREDELEKIVLRQHQSRAVEKVVARSIEQKRKTGLIWHTQGSGKTFTMIVSAERLIKQPEFEKPTIIMLVDRNELESQLFLNLEAYGFESYKIAESKAHLQELLSSDYRGLIVSMIHKFEGIPKDINTRENVFVLVDEAHRTTSGDLGNYLMAALPNATYFGFTGTPIDKILYGKGTFKVFGREDDRGYLDKYSIAESIEDGTTLPLHYTLAPNEMLVPRETLEKEFYAMMEKEGVSDIEELNKILDRAVNTKNFLKATDRVEKVAQFVAHHYLENVMPMGYKAFLVGVDREACALYKKALDKHLPPEYSTVVYSPAHNDRPELKEYYLEEAEEKETKKVFRKKDSLAKILIVTEKLLTGYDAPILYCMYLDKPMKDHTLLQAIARVNRPYEDEEGLKKPSGFVLDFVGIFDNMEKALAFDSADVTSVIKNIDVLKNLFAKQMKEQAVEYLNLLKGKTGDKLVEYAIEYFTDKEKREAFFKFFKQLESLYEIISPDKFLRDYISDYIQLSHLYQTVLSAFMPRVHADKELMRKTASLVKEYVKVSQLAEPLPIYAINEQTLEALKKDPKSDKSKVVNLTRSIRVFVDDNQNQNPFLFGIGERVEAINELYDNRQVDTIEALKQLEELVKQVNIAKKEQTEKKLDTRTFSIYWVLKTYSTFGVDELSKKVSALYDKYPNWMVNGNERRDLKLELYTLLLKPLGKEKIKEAMEKIFKLIVQQ